MKLHLYYNDHQKDRCLLLIAQLRRATTRPAEECVRLDERLFDTQFTDASPAAVEVTGAESAELIRLCEGLGIKADRVS